MKILNEIEVKSFLKDCTCVNCKNIQPYIWENKFHLCKKCFKKKFKSNWMKD